MKRLFVSSCLAAYFPLAGIASIGEIGYQPWHPYLALGIVAASWTTYEGIALYLRRVKETNSRTCAIHLTEEEAQIIEAYRKK